MNKYYKTLELDKILEMLSEIASNDKTKEQALNLTPVNDYELVKSEIEKTDYLMQLCIGYGSPNFFNFKDVSGSLTRAKSGASLSFTELLNVSSMLTQIRNLSDWHSQFEQKENLSQNQAICDIEYEFSLLNPNKYLEEKIKNTILSENEIADSASSELASIRRKINMSGIKLRETLDKMVRSTTTQKYLQDAIVTMRDGRYVLPVKSEFRGEVSGLVHDTSSTGQTLFIEPMAVVDANNEIKILKAKEQEEIERIIAELSSECAMFADSIIEGFNICVKLNLYFSKCSLAVKMRAIAPQVCNNGEIVLRKARHPLIDSKVVVPIDVTLGVDYDALIITGPNTGGKTVAIKTVGLLTAMTMCGLLIPVSDDSRISIFDNILVDIGDNQSIEQSLSTFSSHMNKVIEILGIADSNSLIMLDELGSGTDPIEGAALAVSIIEELKSKGAKMIVTTHYQELKMYAIEQEGVQNASCEFDIQTLRPTYRLIIGSPGKSNAFQISLSLGMPIEVIRKAESLVDVENKRFEQVVEQLENMRKELENEKSLALQLRKQAEKNSEIIQSELEKIHKDKEFEIEKARLQASRIIEETKAKTNELLDSLEQIKKNQNKGDFAQQYSSAKSMSKSAFNQLYDTANPVVKRENGRYILPRELKKGDNVTLVDISKNGIVITPPDNSGNMFVQVGIMKTKTNVKNIRLVEKEKITVNGGKRNITTKKSIESNAVRKIQLELDIRGYSSDDGVQELDKFVDNAVMSGVGLVTVIHGKGTGILRSAIHRRLKQIPTVKSFRLGLFGEGEDGVTIVELK